jgi:cytosine deaminase
MDIVIRDANIAGEQRLKDIAIESGRIMEISDRVDGRGQHEIQAQGYLVSPSFMDVHMHLDKALILDRYDWAQRQTQATRRLTSVYETNKVKPTFTVEDVKDRAIRVAKMCAVNGTTTLRTHADVDPVVGLVGIKGVIEAREACRSFMDMQVVANAFCGYYYENGFSAASGMERTLREAIELGVDAVGGVTEADPNPHTHIDFIFSLAKEYGINADFHADQTTTPPPFHIPYICEKTVNEGMQQQVLLGHCIALGHINPEERKHAINLLKEAQVSICATPHTTIEERILQPAAGGVAATYMTDNIRDSWQALGNGDMLQLALFVARLGQVNTNQELDALLEMGTLGAARTIGLADEHGVQVGKRANLVIFQAESAHEAIVSQAKKLWVLKDGNVVAKDGELQVEPV